MSADFRDNVNIIPQSIGFVKGFFEKSLKNSKNIAASPLVLFTSFSHAANLNCFHRGVSSVNVAKSRIYKNVTILGATENYGFLA